MKILRTYFFTVLLLASLLLSSSVVRADDLASGFESANKLYEQGKFAEAAAAYDKLLAAGNISEALYFNHGNALFKQGQLGRAVASYRLAQRLSPRDPDLRTNLQLARTRARGGSPYQPDRWRGLFSKLTLNEWTILLVLFFWLLFILLALMQWRPALKPALRNYSVASGCAVLLLGVCFAVALNNDYLASSVVVVAGEAEVRNGPLDESPALFKVRDGIELSVLDQKDGWLQVADSVQRTGWLRRDQTLLLNSTGSQKPGS